MAVQLTREFIQDIQAVEDANFAKRVFRKLFDSSGNFRRDTNDHRYDGIADCWIRYVSQGSSAFRVIYLNVGEDVLVYRAGPHSVEDRLVAPQNNSGRVAVAAAPSFDQASTIPNEEDELGRYLCSLRAPFMSNLILGRRRIPHKEIVLVSPYLSLELLERRQPLGRMLDLLIEDGTKVDLLTKPPSEAELKRFEDLEHRGIGLLFNERLHTKLYMFVVDRSRLQRGQQHDDLMLMGSANLTVSGYGATRDSGNEELCYQLPLSDKNYLDTYVAHLAMQASDITKTRLDFARANRMKR